MISPELQAELRAKFNPDGSDLRNMQLRMLEMLKYIDQICRENGIKYWLSSGTCLGAVRHGGFIPWDDDVDIEMLEEDYHKLVEILRRNETDEYAIQTHKDDPNYIMDFAKLRDKTTSVNEVFGIDKLYKYQGLFIDIFCMSPSGSKKLHYICGRLRVLEVYCKKWSLSSNIGKCIFKCVRLFNDVFIALSKPLDRINAGNRLRHPLGVTFLKPRSFADVSSVVLVPFEGIDLPVPANYDAYLTKIFGDYMVLKQEHIHLCNS